MASPRIGGRWRLDEPPRAVGLPSPGGRTGHRVGLASDGGHRGLVRRTGPVGRPPPERPPRRRLRYSRPGDPAPLARESALARGIPRLGHPGHPGANPSHLRQPNEHARRPAPESATSSRNPTPPTSAIRAVAPHQSSDTTSGFTQTNRLQGRTRPAAFSGPPLASHYGPRANESTAPRSVEFRSPRDGIRRRARPHVPLDSGRRLETGTPKSCSPTQCGRGEARARACWADPTLGGRLREGG